MIYLNKKALSEVVGYVLLITMGIFIATIVGAWLKLQVPTSDTGNTCPEETSLVILEYNCTLSGTDKKLNLTIKNKGFFTIDGFTIKYSYAPDGKIGLFNLGDKTNALDSIWGKKLIPEENYNYEYLIGNDGNVYNEGSWQSSLSDNERKIYLIEIQPFTIYNGEKNFCPKVSYKSIDKINCN